MSRTVDIMSVLDRVYETFVQVQLKLIRGIEV